MIAYEITVNSKKKVVAGLEDWALLLATIHANRTELDEEDDELYMTVGGLALPNLDGQSEHLRWPKLNLSIGDTVTIRLIEVDKSDKPIKRFRSDAEVQESPFTEEEILELQKKDYLRLKKKFERDPDL